MTLAVAVRCSDKLLKIKFTGIRWLMKNVLPFSLESEAAQADVAPSVFAGV